MAFFEEMILSEYESEYKMKWTKPKIYKPKKGRWYIYYNYQHPTEVNKLGRPKMVRFKLPSFGLNKKYSNYKDRLEAF
ncbi:hypothetical protein MSHRCOH1_03240 [Candidatus Ornithobacterium hominis]|nr:hypothetical protein MSHRCOH1_03240 [Candidatus Ornithobacterium hominis]